MKKINITSIVNIIMLILLIAVLLFEISNRIFFKNNVRYLYDIQPYSAAIKPYKTFYNTSEKCKEYDEDYAVNYAVLFYNMQYGKIFKAEDFKVKEYSFSDTIKCWQVFLKPTDTVSEFEFDGLIISKDNGGVLVFNGDPEVSFYNR